MISLGLLLFTVVGLFKREWALYLIVLLLPTYQIRFLLGPVPMTFLEGMILILAVVEIAVIASSAERRSEAISSIKGLLRPPTLRRGPRNDIFFIILFLAAATASAFVSPVPVKAAGIWKAFFIEPVIFYFLLLRIINTPDKLKTLYPTFAWLALSLSVFGIYQFLTLSQLPASWWAIETAGRRIISLVNHPNALALLIGPLLALLLMLPKKTKLIWLASGLGVVTLFLSLSRAGWLALFITIVGFGLLTQYRKKIIAGAVAVALLVLAVPFAREKLISLARGQDLAQENRIVLWTAAVDMIKKSPVLGVGLKGFHENYKNYPLGPDRVVQNYPHNFILNFWLETGLFGVVAVLSLLVLFYKKRPPLWVAAAMTVVLLHGLVDVPYFKNDLAVLFWTILALPALTNRPA